MRRFSWFQIGKEKVEFYFLLLFSDILALGLSFLGAVSLRLYLEDLLPFLFPYPYSWSLALDTLRHYGWLFLAVPLALAYHRVYDRRLPFWEETREIIKALVLAFFVIYALMSIKKISTEISRMVIGFTWLGCLFLIPFFRYLLKTLLLKTYIFRRKALILGSSPLAQELIRALEKERYMGYEVVGILDDAPEKQGSFIQGKKVYGGLRHIGKFVKILGIDSIFIAVPSFSSQDLSDLFSSVQSLVKEICIVPDFKNFGMLNTEVSTLFSEKIFLIKVQNNLKSWTNRFVKRSFDLGVSILLLPFLLPIIGVVSLLIVLDSPGFPIFVHERIGKGGKTIKVYKFRSMFKDSDKILKKHLAQDKKAKEEWETYFKLKKDPRVTKIGRFLRKTSLDELPQIFNVLKGDMSLVGPRPVTKEELESYYGEYASFYYMVRPGITGLWQVSGRNELSYEERVKLDVWYVLNWSLWLDIILLVRTVEAVLKGQGSY